MGDWGSVRAKGSSPDPGLKLVTGAKLPLSGQDASSLAPWGSLSFECIYITFSGKNLLAFSTVWKPQELRREPGVPEGLALVWVVVWALAPSYASARRRKGWLGKHRSSPSSGMSP